MHLTTLPSIVGFAVTVSAQTMTLQQALASENTTLSTLNGLLAEQPTLLTTLGSAQNITILAPSNAAFIKFLGAPSGQAVAADSGMTAALLEYHVLNGTFPSTAFLPTNQFLPTLLTNSSFTGVTGGQVVNGIVIDKKVEIFSGLKEKSTVQTADIMFTGGVLHIIDTVLTLPLDPGFSAIDSNLTALAGALTDTNLLSTVDTLRDITIFAPSNTAFQNIGSATGSLSTAQLSSILEYHVINNTVGYSTLLTEGLANQSLPTVSGASVNVLVEDGKVFVNSAQVIITDIIVSNGVMHVLDNVLNPTNSTASPIPAATTQAVAFAGAAKASEVPFTSGIVPSTTAPSASEKTGAANANGRQGAVGAAALFGAGIVGMAVL